MRGMADRDINFIIGIPSSLILTILSIKYLIVLNEDGQQYLMIGVFTCWLISKIFALINLIEKSEDIKLSGYLIFTMFSLINSEWYIITESQSSLIKYYNIQMMFLTLPICLSNILMISYDDMEFTHGIYIAMIFCCFFFMGISHLFTMDSYRKDKSQNIIITWLPSICQNFCYWYLVMQSLAQCWIIGTTFLAINFIIFIGANIFLPYKNTSQQCARDYYFLLAQQYFFQFNCDSFSLYSKNNTYIELPTWRQLITFAIQNLNVIILFILKMVFFRQVNSIDIALYCLLSIGSFQTIFLILNLFYKLSKSHNYIFAASFKGSNFALPSKITEKIQDRFIQTFQMNLSLEESCLDEQNYASFQAFLQNIKLIISSVNCFPYRRFEMNIVGCNQSFLICLQNSYNKSDLFKQSTELKDNFFENKANSLLLKELFFLFQENIQIQFEISQKQEYQLMNYLIDIQQFDSINHLFTINQQPQQQKKSIACFEQNLKQLRSIYFSALSFQNNLSQFLINNPKLVLFDLFDQDN